MKTCSFGVAGCVKVPFCSWLFDFFFFLSKARVYTFVGLFLIYLQFSDARVAGRRVLFIYLYGGCHWCTLLLLPSTRSTVNARFMAFDGRIEMLVWNFNSLEWPACVLSYAAKEWLKKTNGRRVFAVIAQFARIDTNRNSLSVTRLFFEYLCHPFGRSLGSRRFNVARRWFSRLTIQGQKSLSKRKYRRNCF